MTSSRKSITKRLLPLLSALALAASNSSLALANWNNWCGGEGGSTNFNQGGEGGGRGEGCYPREGCSPPPCGNPGPGPGPGPTPPPSVPPVVVVPVPPPTFVPPPVFTPPTSNIFPAHNPFIAPTDVSSPYMMNQTNNLPFNQAPNDHALNGIEQLAYTQFPRDVKKEKEENPIYVFPKPDEKTAQYERVSPAFIDFKGGEILVSVHKPATMGLVQTPFGMIAISPNSEVILSMLNGVLRIINLDGMGRNVKIKLAEGPFAGDTKVVSLKPGFELVIGGEKLTRKDIRPRDGLARRHFQLMAKGHLAISELSVASILESSSLLADLKQSITGSQERRIIGDMSKMASVLNYMNGTQGFSVTGNENGAKMATTETSPNNE